MWGKALRVIPRVSKEEWKELDPIAKWLIATRSAIFVLTFFSATVGALLAAADHAFSWPKYLLCAFGLVFAHGANNLANDYTDSARGVDKDNYFRTMYGPQTVEMGLWSRQKMRMVIGVTALLAASCGFVLFLLSGPAVLWLMAVGAFFVFFYTWPLKYIGLGEPTVELVWGPLMVAGTYLTMTGVWSWRVAAIGALFAIGTTSVLFGKHTDKLLEDKAKRIHTLPVILGERNARWAVIGMLALQPILLIWFVAIDWLEFPMLIFLFSLPLIMRTIKIFTVPRPSKKPKDFPAQFWPTYLSGYAFLCSRKTSGLFALGLALSLFVR